jgi:hypothetical protein
MHPRVEIRGAKAPQFSDSHRAYLAFASETLKRLRMNLKQRCCFA